MLPSQLPSESAGRRYKVVFRLLLISNLALGAYLFAGARKKETGRKETRATADSSPPSALEEAILFHPSVKLIKVAETVSEDQKRELFNWMLEEKRKFKPQNREEKKKNDSDKAILKQFLRAES